jgi:hypothetical protein
MEMIQDLLDPVNDNIAIVEDPRTGDVSLPGATVVEVRDQKSFMDLLRIGEAHRAAANTKMNTESSRSHAILMVIECSLIRFLSTHGYDYCFCLTFCDTFVEGQCQKGCQR